MKSYFYKKEYKYMYLSIFFFNFANTLSSTYGTVMLYMAGIPIYLILLIMGLRFLITGLITPLFVVISSKIGIAKCILISNIFSIINSYFMINSGNLIKNIVIFVLSSGLMGLSNPSSDALSSKYVESCHRGKFNSFYFICKILGIVFASTLVTYGVISNNKTMLFIVITIFFLLQYISMLKIDYKPLKKSNTFISSIKYLVHSNSKYKTIYALKANHIIERLFVPLYIYILLKDFKAFSVVTIISLLFQIITINIIGKYADKSLKNTNIVVSFIKVVITSIYLFVKNKILISINKTLNDNFEKAYETSIQTSIQNIIKNEDCDNELLSSIGQMSLCFSETIILVLLSLISVFINDNVFYVIFILSIVSTIATNIYIRIENNNMALKF